MKDFSTYKAYFENVFINAATLLAPFPLNTFKYGDSNRIIELQKSEMKYPVLWAEKPQYSYDNRGDNITKNCEGAIVILSGYSLDDIDMADKFQWIAQNMAELIMKQMKKDFYFNKPDSMFLEPIDTQFADNCIGVRLTFTVKNLEGNFLC